MRSRAVLAALFVVASACTAGPGAPPATEPPPTTSLATAPTTAGSPAGTASATTAAPSTGRGGLVAGIGDPYYEDLGNPGYDVLAYDIALDYAPASTELTARTTIRATALVDLDRFNLDFTALQVDAVAVDRRGAEYVSVAEELVVRPAEPIPAGEAFEVTVDYSGNPGPTYSEALPFPIGWFNTEGGDSFVAAEPDAAHSWFPSNDHPLDKATFRYEITVPDGVTAAATGTLVERRGGNGVETWVWEMPQPMATYLATVVIGAFDIVTDAAASAEGGVPIRHVLPAGTTVADWPGLERQGEMMRFLVEKFGPYPFDAYGIAIVDGLPGALENQTLSLFGRDAATSRIFEDILIHELAHQWYGNSVSPGRWQDIWLNEGFASYAEWLWIERERGPQALAREIAAERQFWVDTGTTALVGEPLPFELFAGEVYRLGAMTLHSLRLTVGDWVFFEILEEHAARFRDGTAVTADFIALAEELSGRDLDDLFREWLYEPGVPEFPTG